MWDNANLGCYSVDRRLREKHGQPGMLSMA